MHEIFISYRRVDTEAAGGHLYWDLRRAFGDQSVFMDTRAGGIPWGADWEKSLNDALASCEVLIALVGPHWATCERTPGLRRLDAADDWVRGEIATALRQRKKVLPILMGVKEPPPEDQLPDELRECRFHKAQAYPIREFDWEADTGRLFDALAAIPRLRHLRNLATGEKGIRLLEKLIRDDPVVAEAVSRSRAVIETTDREVDEIRLLKGIHEALHEIEWRCLIPVREQALDPGTAPPLDGRRRMFGGQEQAIRESLRELAAVVPQLPVVLGLELPASLTAAAEAFDAATAGRSPNDLHRVVGALEGLFGDIPGRLHDSIEYAATRLELRQLRKLMASIGDLLRPSSAGDHELKPMFDGIAALDDLEVELALRVREHGLLQSLDNLMRQISGQCPPGATDHIEPATLVTDWHRIRTLRGAFQAPFSGEMEEAHLVLEALEPGIEEAIERADEPDAVARLHAYTIEVGERFRAADGKLKERCFELREKTLPLKTILDMCRVEVRHA